jgi:hypothetical protein
MRRGVERDTGEFAQRHLLLHFHGEPPQRAETGEEPVHVPRQGSTASGPRPEERDQDAKRSRDQTQQVAET